MLEMQLLDNLMNLRLRICGQRYSWIWAVCFIGLRGFLFATSSDMTSSDIFSANGCQPFTPLAMLNIFSWHTQNSVSDYFWRLLAIHQMDSEE